MAYQALYRTFRSQTFEGVVGQKETIQTLKNAIIQGKTTHAYLFTGPRGTGKTSAARIFAKAINCPNQKDGEPCNSCEICQGITNGTIDDIIELDAASNNGVDEIRNIRDTVIFPPKITQKKIYIIDEVHMLSTGAFNALLKTLEEPPGNVVFILATTEVYKVPATIISRTQRFDFKRIDLLDIQEHLAYILKELSLDYDEKALQVIARKAQGGMRDALSILDQAISFSDGKITLENAMNVTGSISFERMDQYLEAIYEKDVAQALACVEEILNSGKDARKMLEDVIQYLRDLLLFQSAKDFLEKEKVFFTEKFQDLSEKISKESIYAFIEEFNQANLELKTTLNTSVVLEVVTIKLATTQTTQATPASTTIVSPTSNIEVERLQDELLALKQELSQLKAQGITSDANIISEKPVSSTFKDPVEKVLQILPKATKEIRENYQNVWEDLLNMLDGPEKSVFYNNGNSEAIYAIGAGSPQEIVIVYKDKAVFTAGRLANNQELKIKISNSLSRLTSEKFAPEVIVMTEKGWKQVVGLFKETSSDNANAMIPTEAEDKAAEMQEEEFLSVVKEVVGEVEVMETHESEEE